VLASFAGSNLVVGEAPVAAGVVIAIKRLPTSDDPEKWTSQIVVTKKSVRRLESEAALLMRAVGTDHLVRCYGFDTNLKEVYLEAMHESVKAALYRFSRRITAAEQKVRNRLITEASRALLKGTELLHSLGIWHRDLKSDNLLLQCDPNLAGFSSHSVKICDLGYSIHSDINGVWAILDLPGTAPYYAPAVLFARTQMAALVKSFAEMALELPEVKAEKDKEVEKALKMSSPSGEKLCEVLRDSRDSGSRLHPLADKLEKQLRAGITKLMIDWEACDAWSCGVVVWELFNGGTENPYPEFPGNAYEASLQREIKAGKLPILDKSKCIPNELKGCWKMLVEKPGAGVSFFNGAWAAKGKRETMQELFKTFEAACPPPG